MEEYQQLATKTLNSTSVYKMYQSDKDAPLLRCAGVCKNGKPCTNFARGAYEPVFCKRHVSQRIGWIYTTNQQMTILEECDVMECVDEVLMYLRARRWAWDKIRELKQCVAFNLILIGAAAVIGYAFAN